MTLAEFREKLIERREKAKADRRGNPAYGAGVIWALGTALIWLNQVERPEGGALKFDRPQRTDRGISDRWNEAQRKTNPPIEPNPKLKQEFPGMGPVWLVVAGVAGLVFIFLYIRMAG